ncbi:MAG: TIR domain-containing protein, partial [Chloroflexota bacterium]
MSDVFISYSRRDADFGKRLHTRLTATNYDVWMDWEDIPPTADWWGEIREGIEEADNFVLIMSPDSISSPVCQMEIETAIVNGKRIIPLFYRDPQHEQSFQAAVERTANDRIVRELLGDREPMQLSRENWRRLGMLNWVFFNEEADFDTKFVDLLEIINTDLEHAKEHTRLLNKALEWEASGRATAPLLDGPQIADAESWLAQAATKSPEPTQLQSEYIIASRAHQQAIQRRLFIGVAVALLISIGMTIIAVLQTFEARDAEAEAQIAAIDAATSEAAALVAATNAALSERDALLAATDAAISEATAVAAAATSERLRGVSQDANSTAIANELALSTLNAAFESELVANAAVAAESTRFAGTVNDLRPVAVIAPEFAESGVNVRVGPGLDFDRIGIVGSDEALRVLGFDSDAGEWIAVQLANNKIGYVQRDLVIVSDS